LIDSIGKKKKITNQMSIEAQMDWRPSKIKADRALILAISQI